MEEKFGSLAELSDLKDIKVYVQNLSLQKITSELSNICSREDGSTILQILFKRISSPNADKNIRAKVFDAVLSLIQNNLIPQKLSKKLIFSLACEVKFLSTPHLVSLINKCLLQIQQISVSNNDSDNDEWVNLMPQLLIELGERLMVEFEGTNISGSEFKGIIINKILSVHSKKNIAINLAYIFKDVSLSREEHLRVTNHLCEHIKNVELMGIPPLVYQLLQLTKEQNNIQLFVTLGEFFKDNLYKHFEPTKNISDSQKSSKDIILKDVQMVEGTVLYHIYTETSIANPQGIKFFIKWMKESLNNPHFILQPFFLTLLLNTSEISHSFEEDTLNLFTSAIARSFAEDKITSKSTWLKSVIPATIDIKILFGKVIQNCCREREKAIKGFLKLGFSLLSFKSRSKEAQEEDVRTAGAFILLNLIEKYPPIIKNVLQFLANQIFQECDSVSYTDCLTKIANKNPLSLLDDIPLIMQILANVSGKHLFSVGLRVLVAILPLTKLSHFFRDKLIIFLRKALLSNQFSKEMAVCGFLELLKNLKITDMKSVSQSGSQNYVGITQLYSGTYSTQSGAISNEGMCLEILAILKRVFDFHYDAKILFYKGVYDTFYVNPKLGVHILENLKIRLDLFYKGVGEIPPLDFGNLIAFQDTSIVIKEPIGHLLLAMGLIIAKIEPDFAGKNKFKEMLDSISEGMSASDISHLNLTQEGSEDISNNFIDNELERAKVDQILKVYEALIGYTLCTWTTQSPEASCKINELFKRFFRLSDYATNAIKGVRKKNEQKKSKDQLDSVIFKTKFPTTILNFKCSYRLLVVLNGVTVDWVTKRSIEPLQGKKDFHRYAFNVILTLITENQYYLQKEIARNKNTLKYIFRIGKIMYTHCLVQLQKLKSFDLQCSLLAMECFKELLHFICNHFNEKISFFFAEIGISNEDLDAQLKVIMDILFTQITELLEETEENGLERKNALLYEKLCLSLLRIGLLLIDYFPNNELPAREIFPRIKCICQEKKIKNSRIAKTLLALLVTTCTTDTLHDAVILNLVLCLCKSMTLLDHELEIDVQENFEVVNSKTANQCLLFICEIVRRSNNEIEWALSRFKAEAVIAYGTKDFVQTKNEIIEKENKICRRLNFNIKIMSMICTIAIPPGSLADGVLKEIGNLYDKLVQTVKYFLHKFLKYRETSISSRFIKTVKMADQELTKNMYCFTEHVIANGSANADDDLLKKQTIDAIALKNKVLKETKVIPKVIYEKEQFQKYVLLLSKKIKVDLEIKNSMARDYRLYTKQVKEIIEKENEYAEKILLDVEETSENIPKQISKRLKTQ